MILGISLVIPRGLTLCVHHPITFKAPCTPQVYHRWMILNASSCPRTAGVSHETINALTAMMKDLSYQDQISLFVDIHFQWSGYSGTYIEYAGNASNTNTVGMMLTFNNTGVVFML